MKKRNWSAIRVSDLLRGIAPQFLLMAGTADQSVRNFTEDFPTETQQNQALPLTVLPLLRGCSTP